MAEIAGEEAADRVAQFPTACVPSCVVHYIPYMDMLAEEIGCRPSPWMLLARPRLLWLVMTGPFVGAMYRLSGPGSCPAQARATLAKLQRGHGMDELVLLTVLNLYGCMLAPFLGAALGSASSFI